MLVSPCVVGPQPVRASEDPETLFFYMCDLVVVCFLSLPRPQFHYTAYHSVVSGSCVGLTRAAFLLLQETLWFHCAQPILSGAKCCIALCIALSNHWRHRSHSHRLTRPAVSQRWLGASRGCVCGHCPGDWSKPVMLTCVYKYA